MEAEVSLQDEAPSEGERAVIWYKILCSHICRSLGVCQAR